MKRHEKTHTLLLIAIIILLISIIFKSLSRDYSKFLVKIIQMSSFKPHLSADITINKMDYINESQIHFELLFEAKVNNTSSENMILDSITLGFFEHNIEQNKNIIHFSKIAINEALPAKTSLKGNFIISSVVGKFDIGHQIFPGTSNIIRDCKNRGHVTIQVFQKTTVLWFGMDFISEVRQIKTMKCIESSDLPKQCPKYKPLIKSI